MNNPTCKHCGSADVIKNGFFRRPNWDSQNYLCHSCKREFTVRCEKHKETDPFTSIQSRLPLPNPPTPFQWSDYNEAQMREKLLFLEILQDLCSRLPEEEPGKVGRPRASTKEMVFCMVAKLYEGLSSRRVSSDLHIAAQRGHIAKVPHFNTVLKYFNDPTMTPFLTGLIQLSSLPLRDFETTFAIDASGLSSAFYSRWFDYRFGNLDGKEGKAHDWIKIHIVCGVKSNIVTSIIVTDGKTSDCPQFPALLKNTAQNFNVREVMADKGYSSRSNFDAAVEVGAIPYIPFKSNATGTARGSKTWSKMFHYFQYRREDFMARYHQRSNVESTFSSLKRKFSTKLMLKNEVGQVNEALAMLLCHNICVLIREAFENGISAEFEEVAHKIPVLHINRGITSINR
jgi:transposase